MYDVSQVYLDAMNKPTRLPSVMELTFHFPSGNVVFANTDIIKVSETKTAHLVAGELPSLELSIQLKNINKLFNPNDTTNIPNYHDMIVRGVKVTYKYGYKGIELVKPYGYEATETPEPVFASALNDVDDSNYYVDGAFENIPADAYGFLDGYQTEWINGGEVYTDGDLSYDNTTVTVNAYDALSFLESPVYYQFSNTQTLSEIAWDVIKLTDYPETEGFVKKLKTSTILESFSTTMSIASISSEAVSPKEWLQMIAYAGGVKMYIDRDGYICLDNEPEVASFSQYTLYLKNQKENPVHAKKQLPSKLTIKLASKFGAPVETNIGGGGEELVIEGNPYIILTSEGEALRDRLENDFIPYRNEAEVVYRGEPALDILDHITLESDFDSSLEGIITNSEVTFDGTLSGSLTIRYQLGSNTPYTNRISGNDDFIYPYLPADSTETPVPTITSHTLTCATNVPTPIFQWSYYLTSIGDWTSIVGATNATLVVNYDDSYFDNDDLVKFKCVINDTYEVIV